MSPTYHQRLGSGELQVSKVFHCVCTMSCLVYESQVQIQNSLMFHMHSIYIGQREFYNNILNNIVDETKFCGAEFLT